MYKLTTEMLQGTSFKTQLFTSYSALREAFGEPLESDGYKVSGEWLFSSKDGHTYTVYDWKETSLYDSDLPSVESFRNASKAAFHVGASHGADVPKFIQWLEKSLA